MTQLLHRLFRRKPKLRDGYHTFDMTRMSGWGHNAFWWPMERVGESACLFYGRNVEVGDLLLDGDQGFVITKVERMTNPDDQWFVKVVPVREGTDHD